MKNNRWRPRLRVIAGGVVDLVAGTVLLVQTAPVVGLDRLLSKGLTPWRLPMAVHDPGNIVLDLAVVVALGGDCAADIALLRAQPGLFELVASDPTVSRLVARLAQFGNVPDLPPGRGEPVGLAGRDHQPGREVVHAEVQRRRGCLC